MSTAQNALASYIEAISTKFSHEETSELGYRTDFEILIKNIFESINVKRIDHDPKAKERNKPDFIVLKSEIPILYIEAKDIGISLDKIEKSEQMTRYYGYTNLVLTDYLEFRFYRDGLQYEEPIKVANFDIKNRTIDPIPENYEHLAKTLVDFTLSQKEPIRSANHLAKIMAGKARRIRDNLRQFLATESDKNTDIVKIYETIEKLLVHDLTKDSFADMYAQTLVYGLFAARHEDETQNTFSRQEARDLIPKSNPFLRDFFDHIVGPNFDKRLEYIVNELCEVFSHADVSELMKQYYKQDLWGETHIEPDPVIHFYEDFLKEYDPVLRKKMGAFYTPIPVVQFIIRSVDYLLKKEFGLAGGLSDTLKTAKGLHKVQVLDPAVGTGTFISKIIRNIYEHLIKTGQKGRWHPYVLHDLLPRIYGFELMMTPYTIAHLKLSLAFKETGFKYFNDRRLGIYLTNSLEESSMQQDFFTLGLAESIAEESKEASRIKNERPIMVVIGNPPYFGESSNKNYKGHDVYKVEPTGGKLKEKNSKWINDDYVKFIRFAESMIERTGEGIVAMITAHGYIDNPTFRGMRWHLMKTFDELYVLDLHGNSNKKEKSPDGSEDKNIFDIKTGVAIFIGIKKSESSAGKAKVYKADLYGSRMPKYEYLNKNTVDSVMWTSLSPNGPNYEWVVHDEVLEKEYKKGFSINDLFVLKNTGVVTKRDNLCIQDTRKAMWQTVQDFVNLTEAEVRKKYRLPDDVRDWKYEWAKRDLVHSGPLEKNIIPISYRPFDTRFMYYTAKARGFVGWPVERITKHFLRINNVGLVSVNRSPNNTPPSYIFITKDTVSNGYIRSDSVSIDTIYPLYLSYDDKSTMSNLNSKVIANIEKTSGMVKPEEVLGYVYATLHSNKYRGKYKELLKKNFPRIPYPENGKIFKKLGKLGSELYHLHLLESPKVNHFITTYPESGSDVVERCVYEDGNVYINDQQYFGGVPKTAWNFYIGGYQPAQKWLKGRKGSALTNEDIEHYQKMIVVLCETEKIMQKIDKVYIEIGKRSSKN